jgi:ribosomal protein S27AE
MSESLFNVILDGTVRSECERPVVVEKLGRIFKKDRAAVEKLLDGTPRRIRQKIDLQTAEKYRGIIEKAGATCRIEPMNPPQPPAEQPPKDDTQPDAPVTPFEPCPRCGYVPAREDDVMIVRGDCPKCGFMVKGNVIPEVAATDDASPETETDDDVEPSAVTIAATMSASLSRRILASLYTIGCFSAVYCCILLLFIICFIPLTSVPGYIAKEFVVAAYTTAPALMAALGILVVSFFVPLFNDGRTWGQKVFSIELLYTPEAQSGGLLASLAFRVGAILLLSLAPGLAVTWSFPETLSARGAWVEPAIIAAMAAIGWALSWLPCLMSTSRRSLLDHAGGTLQTEIGVMPPHALRRALWPLLLVILVLGLLGGISHVFPMLERQ